MLPQTLMEEIGGLKRAKHLVKEIIENCKKSVELRKLLDLVEDMN
jgi:hypothetical protein